MLNQKLTPTANKGILTGMGNMLGKEGSMWWTPKSILTQIIVWTLIINALVVFVLFILPVMPIDQASIDQATNQTGQDISAMLNFTPEVLKAMAIEMFFSISAIAMLIGAVIICNDSILKERESGTAAWVLSKPVSRLSFVMSKFITNGLGLLTLVVLIQGIITVLLIFVKTGTIIDVVAFAEGMAILWLIILFYGYLAMMLGTFMNSRAASLGIPIGMALIGSLLVAFVPEIGYVLPFSLGDIAAYIALGMPLPSWALYPVVCTVGFILMFVAATVVRFNRAEL